MICILLIEEDQAKKINGIKKVMRSVDRFINYYHDDGGCEEGPSYWSHAGGKLFEVLELLYKVSDGKIDIYGDPLIANMGRYIYRAYIADPYFINFADASARIHTLPGIIYRYGKRISDPNMTGFGAFLADSYNMQDQVMIGKIESSLENLMNVEEILNAEAKEPLISEFWLPVQKSWVHVTKRAQQMAFTLQQKVVITRKVIIIMTLAPLFFITMVNLA